MNDPEFTLELEKAQEELRFAISLTLLREKRGLTQEGLGVLVGAKQPMIARYEKGQIPSVAMIKKLTHALNAVFIIEPNGSIKVEPAETHKAAA